MASGGRGRSGGQIEQFNQDYNYHIPDNSLKAIFVKAWKKVDCMKWTKRTIPILEWIPEYDWKRDLTSDVISGVTIAILHIPQGMGFAMLGHVPPVIGIYMGIFPVLIYFIFGTSRHVNQGTFAVTCLMTGKVVKEYENYDIRNIYNAFEPTTGYTNIQVAIAVTFVVAVMELVMYVLRFGIMAQLLSEALVSGFTCAAAFHVVNSQLKDVFGLPIEKREGYFTIPLTVYDVITRMLEANVIAVIISTLTICALTANILLLKPWMSKKTKIPFPIELLLILLGIFAIDIFHLESKYDVTIVGHIPKGFPKPSVPPFKLMPEIWVDCLFIALVSYVTNLSMAFMFANKFMYDIDSNQELLALGLSNVLGSFLSCLPMCVSLSRSVIQVSSGGVTQIVSVVSAVILVIILLWLAPFFQNLPRCLLASIIVESLKGLVFQFTKLPRIWRLSPWDGIVWLVTFWTTFLISISMGLAAGLVISLISLFLQGYKPRTSTMGVVPNTDIYLDVNRYKGAKEIDGLKIFQYSGGLSFASKFSFKDTIVELTNVDPSNIIKRRKLLERKRLPVEKEDLPVKCLVIDCSKVTFIDPSGVAVLRTVQADFAKIGIAILLVVTSASIYEVFKRCDEVEKKDSNFLIFPTLHSAVQYGQENVL